MREEVVSQICRVCAEHRRGYGHAHGCYVRASSRFGDNKVAIAEGGIRKTIAELIDWFLTRTVESPVVRENAFTKERLGSIVAIVGSV